MSDFLLQMAASSAERAAAAPAFGSADFDLPVVPLELGGYWLVPGPRDTVLTRRFRSWLVKECAAVPGYDLLPVI